MKLTISAGLNIHAPAETVWQVLVDLERYPEWNPFTPRIESSLVVGDPITIHVRMRPGRQQIEHEHVTRFIPGREFAWGTLFPAWLMQAERVQRVEALGPLDCSYYAYESFSGLGLPVVMGMKADIQRGFDAVALALKQRAESMAGA